MADPLCTPVETKESYDSKNLWAIAYRRYLRLWMSLAKSSRASDEDAKDIVHSVIASILSDGSYKFVSLEHLRNYVARAVLNRVIQHRQQIGRRSSLHEIPELPADITSDDTAIPTSAQTEGIKDAILRLRKRDFEIIKLRFFSGLKFSEIRDITGKPISTLKSREVSALKKIRKALRKKGITRV